MFTNKANIFSRPRLPWVFSEARGYQRQGNTVAEASRHLPSHIRHSIRPHLLTHISISHGAPGQQTRSRTPCSPGSQPTLPSARYSTDAARSSRSVAMVWFRRFRYPNRAMVPAISKLSPPSKCRASSTHSAAAVSFGLKFALCAWQQRHPTAWLAIRPARIFSSSGTEPSKKGPRD